MSPQHIDIRELASWGFDMEADRSLLACDHLQQAAHKARRRLEVRQPYKAESPISVEQTRSLASLLAARKKTVAGSGEFEGLAWELAIVDLRKLIAFQRRVGFADGYCFQIEQGTEWQQLLDLALPIDAHSSNPYIEVALFSGRWFLRDGYHRSFRLLKQGMCLVPAVVVYAETLAQMGAIGTQFFAPVILFSQRPPMVTDFLDEEIVVCYRRAFRKHVVNGTVQEFPEPVLTGCHEQEGL